MVALTSWSLFRLSERPFSGISATAFEVRNWGAYLLVGFGPREWLVPVAAAVQNPISELRILGRVLPFTN